MKTLTFIRHGESTANAGGMTMPDQDVPLSELGEAQALKLTTLLQTTPPKVLVSSFLRSQQTARPFCQKLALPPEINPYLNEFVAIDSSRMEGLYGEQRKPLMDEYWERSDPYLRLGEKADTFIEFNNRVSCFIEDMETLPHQTIIFGHSVWLALLVWRLLGYPANNAEDMQPFRRFQLNLPVPNCSIFKLKNYAPQQWCIKAQ